jgi:hypothetical protein
MIDFSSLATREIRREMYIDSSKWWNRVNLSMAKLLETLTKNKANQKFWTEWRNEHTDLLETIDSLIREKVTLCYVMRYEAVGLGNISMNDLKTCISGLIELAEWEETFSPESEIDNEEIIWDNSESCYSEWITD